jgi:hypothetical protein
MTPYEDKTFKDTMKEERTKLKDMSWKDKIWYIWEYYKFPIIGVVLAVFLVGSIGTAVYNNRFDTAISFVVINSQYPSEEVAADEYFDQGFRQFIGLDENTRIDVDYSMSLSFDTETMTEYTYAQLAKITAIIASKELDVMISTPDTIDHYGSMGGFMDLRDILPDDLYEQVEDRLYTVTAEETGEQTVCGILLDAEDFSEKTDLTLKTPIFTIVSNTTRPDTAVALIRYILEE